MLVELRVKNFGIIEEIDWSPSPGLNVITGETGAGKSLIIDAVEALLAGTAGDDVIRHGATEARLEGIFTLPNKDENFSQIRELLIKNGLEADEETLVVYCEFRRQGRDVLRVNRHAITRGLLHQIGRSLLDIYGQTQHMSLLNSEYQLDFLDSYAGTIELRRDFSARAVEMAQVEQELKRITEEEKDTARREEFLRFQIDEISRAELQEGQEEELERQKTVLASTEKLKASSYEAYQAIYGADKYPQSVSALEKLNEALLAMKKLVEVDSTLKSELDYVEETAQGLAEVARDIRSYSDRLEYDPQRLEAVESRLELINSLKRKYGQTIAEILTCLEQAEGQLEEISHSTERRVHLEEKRGNLTTEMGGVASALSEARIQAAEELVIKVKGELQDLNMSQVDFQISITQQPSENGIPLTDGVYYTFTKDGIDQVEFMASTNPGEPLKPLAKIASTGEISRFMLALKGALSEADNIPVLIFDEIDIGIGGRSGEIIGEKLCTLARNRQVICVTHLPQIAAFADTQYSIHKESVGDRTLSLIETLDGESKVREIAVMLSGPGKFEAYIDNARELILKSNEWKINRRGGK
ncbi:DNA repair protein RecN [Chloroflexota bacterium]